MKDLTLAIPLIDLIETANPKDIYWSYWNFAKQFQHSGRSYNMEGKQYYSNYGTFARDETYFKLYIKQYSFLGFKTIAEETAMLELFVDADDVINDNSGFKIALFSAKFQIEKVKAYELGNYIEDVVGYFDKIEKINFEEENFCPDPKELDIVAKYFLGIIEPEKYFDFLNFHFFKYDGDCYDFVKHSVELTNEIWNSKTPKSLDLEREIKFKEWVNYVVDKFKLDKIKLGLTSTDSVQTDLVKIGNPTTSATVEDGKEAGKKKNCKFHALQIAIAVTMVNQKTGLFPTEFSKKDIEAKKKFLKDIKEKFLIEDVPTDQLFRQYASLQLSQEYLQNLGEKNKKGVKRILELGGYRELLKDIK